MVSVETWAEEYLLIREQLLFFCMANTGKPTVRIKIIFS